MWFAIAKATVLDLVRRPTFIVGLIGLGAVLALLPRMANPAAGVADNASLALELTLSTLGALGPLLAGCLCCWGVQRQNDAGLTLELVGSKAGVAGVLLGRWVGSVGAAAIVVLGAAVIGRLGWVGVAGRMSVMHLIANGAVLAWLCGGLALGGAVGAAWGAYAKGELAFLAVVLHLGAVRLIGSASAGEWPSSIVASALPDPGRLDVAREIAFSRPTSFEAALLGLGAALVCSAGLLVAAVVGCRRRTAGGAT